MNFLGVDPSIAAVELIVVPKLPGFCKLGTPPALLVGLVALRFVEDLFEPPNTVLPLVDFVGLPVREVFEFHPILGPSSFVGLEERDEPLEPPAPNLGGLARRLGVLSLSFSSAERTAELAWLLLNAILVVLERLIPPLPPPPPKLSPEEPPLMGDGRVILLVGLEDGGPESSGVPVRPLEIGEAGLAELKLKPLPVLIEGNPVSFPRSIEDGFTPGAAGKGRFLVGEVEEEDETGNFPSLCICWIC